MNLKNKQRDLGKLVSKLIIRKGVLIVMNDIVLSSSSGGFSSVDDVGLDLEEESDELRSL